MKKNNITFTLTFMLTFSSIYFIPPPIKPDAVASTSTTINQSLQPFTGTVTSISKPPPIGQMGLDKGTNKIRFTQTSIQFFRSSGGNITIHFPSVGANLATQTLKNSTHIAYHFTGSFMGHMVDMFVYFRNSTNPYDRKIIITGTISGLVGTIPLSISLDNIQNLTVSNCDTNNTPKVCTVVFFGSMGFSWVDIPGATYNNVTRILSFSVGASFFFDPLALDGSTNNFKNGTNVTCTLTTTSTNDVIIVYITIQTNAINTISDTAGLTWTQRLVQNMSGLGFGKNYEYYAISSNALTNDVITITQTGSSFTYCIAFGISGANTGTPFDPNGSLPGTNTGGVGITNPSVIISTSHANDMLISSCWAFGGCTTRPTGFTDISGFGSQDAGYNIVSIIQTNLVETWTIVSSTSWGITADAVQKFPITTEQVTLLISPIGAPNQGVVTISGCNPSITSHAIDGIQFTFTANSICVLTYTVSAASTNIRDCFSIASACSTTTTFTTGADSTTDTYTLTIYHQLRQLAYQATPVGPTIWDASYTINIKGTFLEVSSSLLGTIITTTGQDGVASSPIWADNNLPVTVDSPISLKWIAFPTGSNVFTQSTGGNTNNVNYILQTKIATPPEEFPVVWILLFVLLGTIFSGALIRRIAINNRFERQ